VHLLFLSLNKIVTTSIWVVFIFCQTGKPFGRLVNFLLYQSCCLVK